MRYNRSHRGIGRVPSLRRFAAWALFVLCWPLVAVAEQAYPSESHLAFYEQKALEDAAYEQMVTWNSEEDELDYWQDQRNFEEALHESNLRGYQVYLNTKRKVYMAHWAACGTQCQHGDYFQLQAAYYLQNGRQEILPQSESTALNTGGDEVAQQKFP